MKYKKIKIEQIASCKIVFKLSRNSKRFYCLSFIHPIKGHIKTIFNGVVNESDYCDYIAYVLDKGTTKAIQPGTIVYLPIAEGGAK